MEETSSDVKTHEEILELLDEVKRFEKEFEDFEVAPRSEVEEKEEFIEVEHETTTIDTVKPIPLKTREKKAKHKKRFRHPIFRIKFRTRAEVKKLREEKKAATFRIRFDEEGKLVNLDIKKPKPSKEKPKKLSLKKLFVLKKLIKRGKGETEETETKSKPEGEGSKFSKLKGGLSKLSKLKGIVPGRSRKEKKSEETKTEE
ncbi:hypothetical protein DRN50_08675 [Thermococci archaeon]|nr:MAG: hypothetical protein DRN50_08675 [Thermococci archaeon]